MRVLVVVLAALLVVAIAWDRPTLAQTPATVVPSDRNAIYLCPMHPDVRGHAGDSCARCGMRLVPASAADYRPYYLDVDMDSAAIRAGHSTRVRFVIRRPEDNSVVRSFESVHERLFHLFVVGQDLEYFSHIHPTLHRDGTFDVSLSVPAPGAYRLVADFVPQDGPPQFVERAFVTAGYDGGLSETAHLTTDVSDKVIDGTRVHLSMSPAIAGREQLVTFDLSDESSRVPLTNLDLYLGAVGHLFEASADLATVSHDHPVAGLSSPRGPTVVFQVLFPRPGEYRIWVQFQRAGVVITAPFTIPVVAPA